MSNIDNLNSISAELRLKIIEISHRAQSSHLGGSLSCVDILTALYWYKMKVFPKDPNNIERDRMIFSKGHAISALYVVLAKKGFFPESDLLEYNKEGSNYPEHPSPNCAPGVEWATGSLGHGLGVATGMAKAAKLRGRSNHVFVVLSDGECQEGAVWEAAMFAARHSLDNLTAIVDFNKWQATGRSCEIMQMEPFREKFESFGWKSVDIDGHDLKAICDALDARGTETKPLAIIANTVKGKGASYIEDDNNWHYRSPTAEEVEIAKRELGL